MPGGAAYSVETCVLCTCLYLEPACFEDGEADELLKQI